MNDKSCEGSACGDCPHAAVIRVAFCQSPLIKWADSFPAELGVKAQGRAGDREWQVDDPGHMRAQRAD